MRTQGFRGRVGITLAASAIILAACSSGAPTAPSSASASAASAGDPTTDKLAQVKARGTLVLWTDPDYAPQSMAVDGATRAADTKCGPNEMTAPEMTGYDAETGKLVAAALGVEPCFVATPFDAMIAGSWGDRFDVAWGSGAITADRMKRLYVTQPYYSTPANFFVNKDSTVTKPTELSGKQIGACSGCTHDSYLDRTLELPGTTSTSSSTNPNIVTFDSEPPGSRRRPPARSTRSSAASRSAPRPSPKGRSCGARHAGLQHVQDRLRRSRPDPCARAVPGRDRQRDPGPPRERQAQGPLGQVLRQGLRDGGGAFDLAGSARPCRKRHRCSGPRPHRLDPFRRSLRARLVASFLRSRRSRSWSSGRSSTSGRRMT